MSPMRTRISTDGVYPFYPKIKYVNGGTTVDPLTLSVGIRTVPTYFNEIDDVVGNRTGFNPVKQVKIQSNVKGLVDFVNEDNAAISIIEYPLPWFINNEQISGLCPLPSASLLDGWGHEAFDRFYSQIPTEVSVANFLYELKDIKGLLPKIEKSITRTASSNFLGFEFGVKPFIGDVRRMMSLGERVNKRIQYLLTTAGQDTRLSFQRAIEPSGDVEYKYKPSVEWHDGADIIMKRVGYEGTFHASGRLVQNLDILNDQFGTLKAFAAATGFNNPAAIVWEAIPYSFVVDWFTRFGSQLDRLAIQPFGGKWEVSQVGYSLREQWTFLVDQHFYPWKGNPRVSLGTVSVRRYLRFPGLPTSPFSLGELNPKQQLLSMALLEQRRR